MLDGLRAEEAAQAAGVSVRTAYKWWRRFRQEGLTGLDDRSSRPIFSPHATSPAVTALIIERRQARHSHIQIAQELHVAVSTVARILKRQGLNRLSQLQSEPPLVRYEADQPGDLLHLDIKKLGRFKRPGHRVLGPGHGKSRGMGWKVCSCRHRRSLKDRPQHGAAQ